MLAHLEPYFEYVHVGLLFGQGRRQESVPCAHRGENYLMDMDAGRRLVGPAKATMRSHRFETPDEETPGFELQSRTLAQDVPNGLGHCEHGEPLAHRPC